MPKEAGNASKIKQKKEGIKMKKMKRFVSALLAICLIAVMIPVTVSAAESGSCGDNLTWTLNKGVLTISGTGPMYNYNIYMTNQEAPWYESRNAITSLVIKKGVTSIGEYAFAHCTSLTEVTIPDSVTTIESCAFFGCSALYHVTFGKGLTSIGSSAFGICYSLDNVTIPDNVTEINAEAFSSCEGMTNITLGKGITAINHGTFAYCSSLKKVTIPNNVTTISNYAFRYCTNLSTVTLSNNLSSIGEYAFERCYRLKEIAIPGSVVTIGRCAFYSCSDLANVSLGNGIITIDQDAFGYCDSLATVTIPNSVTTIGGGAFTSCANLTSVTIGKNVRTINQGAFSYCRNLTEVTFRGNAPYIGDNDSTWFNTFSSVTATVYYPANNSTWDSKVGNNYGGNLTWVAVEFPLDAPVVKSSNKTSTGKISLSWEEVDGAVKYEVYRATSKNGTYKLMKTTTSTSYTNTSATAGKYYYYYVRAISAGGKYADSSIVGRTCDLAQTTVTLSNVASSGKIKVSWEAVEGATKYEVYRATSKTGTYKLMKTTTSTSYTNTGAEAGKTYYYKVRAICDVDAAAGAYSSIKSRTCDLPRPDVSIALSSGKPKVSWKAVDGAVEYEVYRATSKNGTYSKVKTTTKTSYTNTSATAGKTYYYKVIAAASKSSADSAYSSVVSIKSK